MKFRVKDLSNNQWVIKDDNGDISPTAENKKDATVFEGDRWLEYWNDHTTVEIVPLETDEILAAMRAPRLPGLEEVSQ